MPDVNSTNSAAEPTAAAPVADTPAERPLPEVPAHLGRDLALYTLVRFGLVAVVAVVLALVGVPVLLGIAVGLIVGLPLAMLLLRGWHNRVSAGLAARSAHRAAQRARLRAELRGEVENDTDDTDAVTDTAGAGDPAAARIEQDAETR